MQHAAERAAPCGQALCSIGISMNTSIHFGIGSALNIRMSSGMRICI